MGLRGRLTCAVTLLVSLVLGAAVLLVSAVVESHIRAEALALDVADFETTFDGLGGVVVDDGLLAPEIDVELGVEFEPDVVDSGDEVLVDIISEAETSEILFLATELASADDLATPWDLLGLPAPGGPGGGLVSTSNLALVRVSPDGSVEVIEGSAGDQPKSIFVDEFRQIGVQLLSDDADVFSVASPAASGVLVETPDGSVAISTPALQAADEAAETVTSTLWTATFVMILLTASITWFMTGRALRPVEAITRRVNEISGGNLHERVPERPANDEVGRLARTMNDMLGRIEGSDARRREFVSDASHELRSPVASIRTELEVAEAYPETVEWAEVARNVKVENDRLDTMISSLLTLARFDEGAAIEAEQVVDLDDLVVAEARRTRAFGVDISEVSAGRVRGRAAELGLVARHLLDNAARHANSKVKVTLTTKGGAVCLVVEDDGEGIPTADREVIFGRFSRLQEGRDRDSGGAGLGLAVVAGVVARHGGSIRIEDSEWGGARVAVELPATA